MSEVRPGIYRHFKFGNYYTVYGVASDATNPPPGASPRPPQVFYRQNYPPFDLCYRDVDDFLEEVDRPEHNNYRGPRFTFIRAL